MGQLTASKNYQCVSLSASNIKKTVSWVVVILMEDYKWEHACLQGRFVDCVGGSNSFRVAVKSVLQPHDCSSNLR